MRATARRALNAATGDPDGYTAYLDRFHSRLWSALAVCALNHLLYRDSPVVALRHHAPVGHFFGVPSTAEISDAWLRTWERLAAPWPDGANPLAAAGLGAPDPAEALPGMSALVSAVAGRTVGPGTLIRDIGADVAAALAE